METGDQNTQSTNPATQPNRNATSPQGSVSTPSNKTLMAVLAYIGILIVIPFFTSKDDSFVKFHLKQGAVLFVIEIIVWVLGMQFMWVLAPVLGLINLGLVVLAIIGIVNAVQGKEKELPLIGQFAKHFNF